MKRRTKEADFGLRIRHWYRRYKQQSGPLELKQTETNSLKFSELKEEQANFLLAAKSDKGVMIRVVGWNGEPDYAYYRLSPAWVFIRYPDCFCMIDIEDFLFERDRGHRRSLTSERAREIAHRVEEL